MNRGLFATDLAQLGWGAEICLGEAGQGWLQQQQRTSPVISALVTSVPVPVQPLLVPGRALLQVARQKPPLRSVLRGSSTRQLLVKQSLTRTVLLPPRLSAQVLLSTASLCGCPVLRSDVPKQRALQAAGAAAPAIPGTR